jgi:hypothetical protein
VSPHRPPFLVDYSVDGRVYGVLLQAPADWAAAEAHLRALKITGKVIGSSVETHATNVLMLWIDGLAVWLKARWRNWRGA